MKIFTLIRRQTVPLVVICCVVFLGAQSALAQQTISYPNFSSTTGLQINGNAAVVNNGTANVLRLTPTASNQVGSAWFVNSLSLAQGFSTTFTFQLSGSTNAADGIAFVVQNGSFPNGTSGPFAVFEAPIGGGSLGLTGLTHSLAIEFDVFCNGSDICVANSFSSANEVGILSCGAGANSYNHASPPTGCGVPGTSHVNATSSILADGTVHTAVITYTPTSPSCDCSSHLTVTLDTNPILNVNLDLASLGLDANDDAFVGFTGATGALFDNQDILSWTFTSTQSNQTTPQESISPGATTTFTEPGVLDQSDALPAGTDMGGAAFMSVTFMNTTQNVCYAILAASATNGPNPLVGGTPVAAGSTCTVIKGTGTTPANDTPVVTQNLCFGPDPTRTPIFPCNITAPAAAKILLTSHYVTESGVMQPNPAYFLCSDNTDDCANITTDPTSCCTISGGTNRINSREIIGSSAYTGCLLYDPTKAKKSGSTIPLKMYLCDSTSGSDISGASLVVHATRLVKTTATTTDLTIDDAGNSNPDNDFRFDSTLGPSGGYIFNLQTTGLTTGTYNLYFTVNSDVEHLLGPPSSTFTFQIK